MRTFSRFSLRSLTLSVRAGILALALGSVCSIGCGEPSDPMNPPSSKRGYVTCGSVTCNPGQHCDNLFCQAGCQSNDNCAADQTCTDISQVSHVGTCQNVSSPDMATPKDSLTRCKDACLQLVSCSLLSVNEGSGCQTDCTGLSDTQRVTFSTCVESWSCKTSSSVPGCLSPIQCGGDFKCSGGKSCVGHKCL